MITLKNCISSLLLGLMFFGSIYAAQDDIASDPDFLSDNDVGDVVAVYSADLRLLTAIGNNDIVLTGDILSEDDSLIHRKIQDQYGTLLTPLQFFLKYRRDKKNFIKLFLERGASAVQPDSLGASPLYYAVSSGDAELLQLLLDVGAQVNDACCKRTNDTPLHIAARREGSDLQSILIVEKLLSAVASVESRRELLCAQNIQGMTPLHIAASLNRTGIVKLFLESMIGGSRCSLAFQSAVKLQSMFNEYRAQLCVACGGKLTSCATCQEEFFGKDAVSAMALLRSFKVLSLINKRDAYGWSALHHVAGNHFNSKTDLSPTVHLLLAMGADMMLKNNTGDIPADIAIKNWHMPDNSISFFAAYPSLMSIQYAEKMRRRIIENKWSEFMKALVCEKHQKHPEQAFY